MGMDYDIPRPNKEQIERIVMDFARNSAQNAKTRQETTPRENAQTNAAESSCTGSTACDTSNNNGIN